MNEEIQALLTLPNHPFFTGCVGREECNDLPASLPFRLGIHPKYAIPSLLITEEIRTALNAAYSAGSMASTPLGESPLAMDRMSEVFGKLLSISGGVIEGKRFLEIGCGNGELLNQLKLRGAVVTGLEIGPQAEVAEARYGIRVLREPLAVGTMDEKYDCIYSYGCLEHIEDLDGFFAASREHLIDGGLFFHSVPNSALSFDRVHLDHLLHEHVNYFTPNNAVALLEAQGFCSADSSLTKAGNELMLWGFHKRSATTRWPQERCPEEAARLSAYAYRLEEKTERTRQALMQFVADGRSIGFYAGGFEYGFFLDARSIRYFDGDVYKHGQRWLPGLAEIESPAVLTARPVDRLIICKPHYFKEIRDSLCRIGVDANCIVDIESLGIQAKGA